MADPQVVGVYYSFRSPFCYLATPRLAEWQETYNVNIRLRPILPLVVHKPDFFQKSNPLMVNYHNNDAHRVAEYLGLQFRGHCAEPDPVVVDLVDWVQTMSQHQPYIFPLTNLGVLAEEMGRGIQFAKELSTLIWSTKNWHEGDQLAEAVTRAGLDLVELDKAAERDATRLQKTVEANQKSLTAAGHWGVPVMVFNDEPFFGQDRLDMLLWRMKQYRVRERF